MVVCMTVTASCLLTMRCRRWCWLTAKRNYMRTSARPSCQPQHRQARDAFGDESGATCAAWIADSRRKAFLAHVGVGTIDQALLGVLPSKFQALRLWGLADRVLIVDEAHAYDAYMGREIETLLEFHAALGGSAIILSATLPGAQRRALIAAYSRGLGQHVSTPDETAYPLVTMTSRHAVAPHPVGTREDRKRDLQVRRIGSLDDALAYVQTMAGKGASVAWIRNSVDDAIEAVQALEAQGLTPVLLHARFAMGDRLDIETLVTETLGRKGSTARRGFVLVGTQILEQSLDYDVDAMMTDLAPIDLMIQRAGRLWRHTYHDKNRPTLRPELLVYAPDPATVTDRDWYRQISARTAAVYDHHGIVWRSAKVLFGTGQITTPEGVRGLIEQVYAPLDFDDIPSPLLQQSQQAHGTRGGQRHFANTNVLKLKEGYAGAGNLQNWLPDTIAPTRLSQPTTVFRLGHVVDGRIVPLCRAEDGDLRLSWALSEVSIAQTKADGVPAPSPERAAMIAAAQASWSHWQREDQPLLVLEPDGDGWRGTATKSGDGDRHVRYDPWLGFRILVVGG
jgi:CRISPR-associated endonuclease/helicase Cas3